MDPRVLTDQGEDHLVDLLVDHESRHPLHYNKPDLLNSWVIVYRTSPDAL